jgi:hypothetical protein
MLQPSVPDSGGIGQHVTLEGQVYHHYLAHWAEAWDVSARKTWGLTNLASHVAQLGQPYPVSGSHRQLEARVGMYLESKAILMWLLFLIPNSLRDRLLGPPPSPGGHIACHLPRSFRHSL